MTLRDSLADAEQRLIRAGAQLCDSCRRPVEDPNRWRHEECPPPPMPEVARDAIARARELAGRGGVR